MKLRELIACCGFEAVKVPDAEAEVTGAYTSDLLSDVMAHCPEGALLITVQNHKNTVAVCTLVGAPAILVAHHRDIPADMLEVAEREGVALLRAEGDQFSVSCQVGFALAQSGN